MMEHDPQPDRERLPLEVEQQIDQLSDEFERAWKEGRAPRIEDYLGRIPEIGRAHLLKELLVVEIDLRRQAGERVDLQAYRPRFSGEGSVVDAALAVLERRLAGRDETEDQPRHSVPQQLEPDPTHIGRFEIRCRLGGGG